MKTTLTVKCPCCGRQIALEPIAKNTAGDKIMQFHLDRSADAKECQGSYRSVTDAKEAI